MITCEKSSWRVMLNSIRHLLILLNIIRPKCVCPHMCVSMRVLLVSSLHVVSVSYCCLFSDTTWFSWGKWCRVTALCSWCWCGTCPELRHLLVWLCLENAAQSGGRGGGGGQKAAGPASPAHSPLQPQRSDWVQVNTQLQCHTLLATWRRRFAPPVLHNSFGLHLS